MNKQIKILCVDFDGVIHSYRSGWEGADVVADLPVPGAMKWLVDMALHPEYQICIYSSRSKSEDGIQAMTRWLYQHLTATGYNASTVMAGIEFPIQKPPAYLTIDDRAICFRGTFPSAQEMNHFKPWYK